MSGPLRPQGRQYQASLSFTVSLSLLRFMSIELVMLSNHLILCYPLLLLTSIFPSIRVFSSESALHIRWSFSFSFSISPSSEYSGLISFRMDWLDLLAVQGTLKSLLQQHSLKTSLLQLYSNFKSKKENPRKERPRILPYTRGLYPRALRTDHRQEHLIAGCS